MQQDFRAHFVWCVMHTAHSREVPASVRSSGRQQYLAPPVAVRQLLLLHLQQWYSLPVLPTSAADCPRACLQACCEQALT